MRCSFTKIWYTTNIQVQLLKMRLTINTSIDLAKGCRMSVLSSRDLSKAVKSLLGWQTWWCYLPICQNKISVATFIMSQFPCSSIQGHHLYHLFWEAERLERCGFKVIACTCDGLSVNRRFFKFHGTDDIVHNPYSLDRRHIYSFSDPRIWSRLPETAGQVLRGFCG